MLIPMSSWELGINCLRPGTLSRTKERVEEPGTTIIWSETLTCRWGAWLTGFSLEADHENGIQSGSMDVNVDLWLFFNFNCSRYYLPRLGGDWVIARLAYWGLNEEGVDESRRSRHLLCDEVDVRWWRKRRFLAKANALDYLAMPSYIKDSQMIVTKNPFQNLCNARKGVPELRQR